MPMLAAKNLYSLIEQKKQEYNCHIHLKIDKFNLFLDQTNTFAKELKVKILVDEKENAPRFSVFNYFYSIIDEYIISRIIADLLNAKGTHGQGILFLSLFIEMINKELKIQGLNELNITKLEETEIDQEVCTYSLENKYRRIDITLINPLWVIGIENKPFSGEQPDQLKDYRRHLENIYSQRPCHMVYISGDCSRSKTDKNAIIIGFTWSHDTCGLKYKHAHLSSWIEESLKNCKIKKVHLFLENFLDWLKSRFVNKDIITGHGGHDAG
jgi:hypothetical protein